MDKLQSHEKIALAANQMAFMANNLNHLKLNLQNGDNAEVVNEIEEYLREYSEALVEGLNEILDFMNDIDATTQLDKRLFEPIIKELNK